jgi:2-isopropylmalate synthase
LEGSEGTAAGVRVLLDSTDGEEIWSTIGVSGNIIEASWQALVDSIEYKLSKDKHNKNELISSETHATAPSFPRSR